MIPLVLRVKCWLSIRLEIVSTVVPAIQKAFAMSLCPSVDSIRRITTIPLATTMLAVACVCPQLASAQGDLAFEPYPVFIVQEEAYARCGPSGDYYRTDPLRHGQEVEVYAETDDGWLGIRPPADSFCWIPAETVEMDAAEETGVIIEDRTVAWIGTHLGRARTYRWQVQLAKGEPVTVVGRSEREGPDGPQLWYRIVPPSGEYRWVHRDQVVMSSEELVASIRDQSSGEDNEFLSGSPIIARTRPAQSRSPLEASPHPKSPNSSRRNSPKRKTVVASGSSILENRSPVGSGLSATRQSSDERSRGAEATAPPKTFTEAMKRGGLLASIEFLGRPRLLEIGATPSAPSVNETAGDANWVLGSGRSQAGTDQRSVAPPVTTFAGATSLNRSQPGSIMQVSGQQPVAPRPLLPATAPAAIQFKDVSAERIAQIELETRGADVQRLSLILSRLMAARATAAEAEPLARAARSLASSSPDPVVAGRARLLAERAGQYIRVAHRRDGDVVIRSIGTPRIPTSQVLPASANQSPAYSPPYNPTANATAYSQSGYLVQVYSARSNSPPFALTDNSGRTLAYVTPVPGVNLRPHLNSRVNVSGNQGFITGLNTPHILATQAIRTTE